MIIRPALPADAAAICAIWNQIIRDTDITFNSVEKTVADVEARIAEKAALGYAMLVAEDNGVQGFATYDQFRPGLGYQHTGEHSITLDPGARGRGIGRPLLAELEAHAKTRGFQTMFACVSAENAAGVKFHAALGYQEVAILPKVGFKFDRWLDLILMRKRL